MRTLRLIILTLCSLSGLAAVVKPTETVVVLPPVWQQLPPQQRLQVVRVAEVDATRLLVERVYGLHLTGDTTVQDLALKNDQIQGVVSATIVGVATVGEPEYRDDGQVWVTRAVVLRTVVERLVHELEQRKLAGITLDQRESLEYTKKYEDKTIDVLGNGAIPGSDGMKKILAKRAAEMDGYRKLAERVFGVKIEGNTTVRDFVLASDRVRASVCRELQGAKPVSITYAQDLTCTVTMQLTLESIVEVVKAQANAEGRKLEVKDEVRRTVFTENGVGAPAAAPAVGAGDAATRPYASAELVVTRVLGTKPVVE